VVTHSEVVENEDNDGGIAFAPRVEYRFEADGKPLTGKNIRFGFLSERFPDRADAERRAAQFRSGASVVVTYDPKRPENCVLETQLDSGVYGVLALGLFWLAGSVWAFVEIVLLRL
jgi:hypothetical protein